MKTAVIYSTKINGHQVRFVAGTSPYDPPRAVIGDLLNSLGVPLRGHLTFARVAGADANTVNLGDEIAIVVIHEAALGMVEAAIDRRPELSAVRDQFVDAARAAYMKGRRP